MPYCPNCRYEYEPEIKVCPDCGVALVDSLPEEEFVDEDNVRWVALHELPGLVHAEMVKEVLQQRGIPCYIKADFIAGTYGVRGTGAAGLAARIYVPEEYFDQGEAILNEMFDHI